MTKARRSVVLISSCTLISAAAQILMKIGMNHVCFTVDDIEGEVAKFRAAGFKTRNEIMDFHSRKLVFLDGPEGVTIELSQWH